MFRKFFKGLVNAQFQALNSLSRELQRQNKAN